MKPEIVAAETAVTPSQGDARCSPVAAASLLQQGRQGAGPPEPGLSGNELAALGRRLRLVPRFFRYYGWWKVRLDPAYALVLAKIGEAREVLDLGAGIGLMEALFAARFPDRRIRGVEWDERKVAVASKLLDGMSATTIEHGDACEADPGSPDAVLFIDMLHYMEPAMQRAMLERHARSLASGGVLIIRELDKHPARWSITERIELTAVRWGWNRGAGVEVLPVEEISSLLRGLGLNVDIRQSGRGVFSANALIIATKPKTSLD